MIRTHIVEASSFTQQRATFNIPTVLASSIKVCHLGAYGAQVYPSNAILGQLACVDKIVIRSGGTVLGQYDRNTHNILEYKMLKQAGIKHRNVYKQLLASNYGCVLAQAGAESADHPGNAALTMGDALTPRVCVDKHSLKRLAVAEANTDFACVDLADILGWCSATYTAGDMQAAGIMPCHIYDNLKLTIEFTDANSVGTGATTIAQPYLIVDELEDAGLAAKFSAAKKQLSVSYVDYELESVFVGAATNSKVFLNGFYGKTVGELVMMSDDVDAFSTGQANEVFRLLVNNQPLLNLTSGVDHPAKKAAFMRMQGMDLYVPLFSDRALAAGNGTLATGADGTATAIYDGPANSASQQTIYYTNKCSYLSLPVMVPVEKLQIDYNRSNTDALTLLFWAQVQKVQRWDSMAAPVVAYM